MTETTVRLHVQQVSGKFNASRTRARNAYAAAFDRGAHFMGGTEAGANPLRAELERAADRAGYQLVAVDGGGWVAAAPNVPVLEHTSTVVVPALHAPASAGGHGPRGVLTIVGDLGAFGAHAFCEQHWLTGYRLGNQGNQRRESHHTDQSEAMVAAVQHGGRGRRTATWAGDLNVDELRDTGADPHAPAAIFKAGGLVSIFDDLERYPDTNDHRTIDVLGRYDPDHRLAPVDVVVHRDTAHLFDHLAVSALYDLKAPRRVVA